MNYLILFLLLVGALAFTSIGILIAANNPAFAAKFKGRAAKLSAQLEAESKQIAERALKEAREEVAELRRKLANR